MNKIINKIMMMIVLLTVYIPTHSMEMRVTRSSQKRSAEVAGLIIKATALKKNKIVKFPCDDCNKSFLTGSDLERHIRVHTQERPYVCSVCHKDFTQKGNRDKHELIHKGEKLFNCDECDKSFIQKIQLEVHILNHTGERPFPCDQCEKSFIQKVHLDKHTLNHIRKKSKKEMQTKPLVVYGQTYIQEKFFSCDQCDQSFTRASDCKAHTKRVHLLKRELTFFGKIGTEITEGVLPEKSNFFSIIEDEFLALLIQDK